MAEMGGKSLHAGKSRIAFGDQNFIVYAQIFGTWGATSVAHSVTQARPQRSFVTVSYSPREICQRRDILYELML